jgi:hypothetical protein
MNRRALGALALAALAVLAGCGGGLDKSGLDRNATYDWSTDAVVTVEVTGDNHRAVYDLSAAGTDRVEVYRNTELGGQEPLSVSALKFRYPNGTVVGADAFVVTQEGSHTVIVAPSANGSMAYTAGAAVKSFYSPVFVEGAHEVVLPAGMRVSAPLFGSVRPGGYTKTIEDNRVHLRWDEAPSGNVAVEYYLERDFYIFTGFVLLLLAAGAAAVVYFRVQIRSLERRREESGLDVED